MSDPLSDAVATAVAIARGNYTNMHVSYSPDGEYTSSDDIVAHDLSHLSQPQSAPQVPITDSGTQAGAIDLLDPNAIVAAAIEPSAPWTKSNGQRELFYIGGCDADTGAPNDNARDKRNDTCDIIQFFDGVPKIIFSCQATTEVGTYYDVDHVIGCGGKGAALIDLGYQECWQVGIHHPGYAPHEALVQRGDCRVWRDVARNFTRGQGDRRWPRNGGHAGA